MLTLPSAVRIYLCAEPVDMRKGIDGLSSLVCGALRLDVFSGHVFVFLGRRPTRVKLLFWDRGGFVLVQKRLERGRFQRPSVSSEATTVSLDATTLTMLLDGIDVRGVRRPAAWTPPSASTARQA